MKKISAGWITGIFLFFTSISVFAQSVNLKKSSSIESYKLDITFEKTTNLVFPFPIISVDRGSQDVLVQKAKGVENILQVKAGQKRFEETNLTVITADGKLYSFLVNYTPEPSALNMVFKNPKSIVQQALFSPEVYNQGELQTYSKAAYVKKQKIHGLKDRKYGISLVLDGLFIREQVMYFRIKIVNHSNISYDIDQLRFFIRDQKKAKRTATQEIEFKPVYVQNNTQTVKGQSQHTFVFALPKFTIPDQKYLAIQLMEKNGGRHLELDVKNRKIIKAVSIESGVKLLPNEKRE